MRQLLPLLLVLTPTAAIADCTDDIREVLHRGLSSGPVQVESKVVGDIEPWSQTLVVVPPDDMHVQSHGFIAGSEMLRTGGRTYERHGGTWIELRDEDGSVARQRLNASVHHLDSISNAVCNGLTHVDGTDELSFSYDLTVEGIVGHVELVADPVAQRPLRKTTTVHHNRQTTTGLDIYTYSNALTVSAPEL